MYVICMQDRGWRWITFLIFLSKIQQWTIRINRNYFKTKFKFSQWEIDMDNKIKRFYVYLEKIYKFKFNGLNSLQVMCIFMYMHLLLHLHISDFIKDNWYIQWCVIKMITLFIKMHLLYVHYIYLETLRMFELYFSDMSLWLSVPMIGK